MASTYVKKCINANDSDHGDLIVFIPKKTFKDRDNGKNKDLPEVLNSRLDNPQYYIA